MAIFTFALKTFGCQMNAADDDAIARGLAARGGVQVVDAQAADAIIINTCVVRKKAEEKAFSFIGALRPLAKSEPPAMPVHFNAPKLAAQPGAMRMRARPLIAVVGCLIPKCGDEVRAKFGHVDLLIPTSEPVQVVDEIMRALGLDDASHDTLQDTSLEGAWEAAAADPGASSLSPSCTAAAGANDLTLDTRQSGLITVQRGCSHGCSFCIVPYVRGPEVSTPLDVIIAQALYYQRHGFNEITLLGQNVLSYGSDFGFSPNFAEMVEAVLEETQIPWVSFLTSQPYDMSDEVIKRVIARPRITPLLHLPVQSGSDRVLERMRRGYTADAYIAWAQKARDARPGLFLTTDFMCGFPGETDDDFAQTMALVERVRFNDAFMFAFSPREGTPAAKMDGQLPLKVRKERLAALIELQRRIAHEANTSYIGQVMDAIVEENTPKRAVVRTAFNKPVALAQCSRAPGEFTRVRITAVAVSSFKGEEAL